LSGSRALRVAVAGATGALGGELLAVLDARRFPLGELVPLASEGSRGEIVEFREEPYGVESDPERIAGCDLLFLCAPPGPSLDLVRVALRKSVPCIDLSGALASSAEVPLAVADLGVGPEALRQPVLASPDGVTIAIALALAPLARVAGLRRVVATTLESVSSGGRAGMESLSAETRALFNQQDLPEPTAFSHPVAFDCVPAIGAGDAEGPTDHESALAQALRRLLGGELGVAVTAVRVPTFAGDGCALALELERAVPPAEAATLLAKAPGVELWKEPGPGPTTRATAGHENVLVGRLRADPSLATGLLLYCAADGLRLAALNGAKLAEARIGGA
jgi:aspartate-semialdehyde dehydrogenase